MDGIHTPVVTPFREDFSIDEGRFLAVLDRLVAAGVHGIVVAGTTGEYYVQTMEERIRLMRLAIERVAGRARMTVGTGAMTPADSLTLAAAAREAGADAVLIASPPYSVPTERENALNALAIERVARLPVLLYNYPGRTGAMMGREFLDRVGRHPHFADIKESSGDIDRLHMLARDYPHIRLSCGMDDQALEFFAWGATSWTCAGSNFAPEAHLMLYRACVLEGDFAKGRRIMTALLPLLRVLEQGGKFVQCIKHGLTIRGLPVGPPRPPLRPLNKDDKRALEDVVRVMDATLARIAAEETT
mgnify:CR=1 FL=1